MFAKLFGGSSKTAIAPVSSKNTDAVVGAIQNIAEQVELLEKRKELLEKKIEAELAKAKQYLQQGNKSVAAAALKKKALYVKQLENIDNQIMRLEEHKMNLEDTQTAVSTVAAMAHATKAQKATMAEFKIEKVEDIMDQMEDVAAQAAEINMALAQPLGGATGIDEDDIETELAEMQAQQLEAELLQPAPIPSARIPATQEQLNLPSVPSTVPAKAKKTAEDELAELEAELAA